MDIWTLMMLAVGLSMDAFAVSVCQGLGMGKLNWRRAGLIALFFGGFQAIMPLIGYLLGASFEKYIRAYDHWIVFGLLSIIGFKMIFEAISCKNDESGATCADNFSLKWLTMMAFATSVDALAVGLGFALIQVDIVFSIVVIGVTTFILSLAGVRLGKFVGARFKKNTEVLGGAVLILIGVKILLEHLGVL